MNHHRLQRGGRVALAALLVIFSHPALAATIVVDETTCTLVDAITAANTDAAVGGCTAGSGADTIELTTNVTLTTVNNGLPFVGDNGLPVVESDIILEGAGHTIERDTGAPAFRLFAVETSGTLTLHDLTLQNGISFYGGAIWNKGTLNLISSTLSGNTASYSGGGIYSIGDYGTGEYSFVTLTNSTVSGN